jgi:polyphenol oxidase
LDCPRSRWTFFSFQNNKKNLEFTEFPRLTIRTADCVCVSLFSETEGYAIVHAGWKGMAAGILRNAVEMFHNPSLVHVFISPCIFGTSYDVGNEVHNSIELEF